MKNSFLIAVTFLSILPLSCPDWNKKNLKFFCLMLPIVGILFAIFWNLIFSALMKFENLSSELRGFVMTILTLILTGGLHMDGFIDSCDGIFSRRDRETKIKILSDSHVGSFAVIGCVFVILAKIFLFSELFRLKTQINFYVPIYSRLGMSVLLNNLPFAKSGGLAVMLGTLRKKSDNFFLAIILAALIFLNASKIIPVIFILFLIIWSKICLKNFGGITGDLLGGFLEISEILLLTGTVIENCI